MYRSTELGFESLYQFFYARGSQKLVIRESKCSQSVLKKRTEIIFDHCTVAAFLQQREV